MHHVMTLDRESATVLFLLPPTGLFPSNDQSKKQENQKKKDFRIEWNPHPFLVKIREREE